MARRPLKLKIKVETGPQLPPSRPASGSRVRPSKMGKWRALVLLLVHVLIGLHIAHWLIAGETITPVEPSEAMAFSQHSVINAGLIFFAVMILLTAVFGRFFCGWACHLLALQDLCRHWMLKLGITPRPLRSRTLMWVPALAFFYMFLWPLLWRWWMGDSLAVREVELSTAHFWATFPGWVIGGLTFLICGFACVYFLGAKGFCTYACPYGAIFSAVDRVAPLRIRVTDACSSCGHCTAVCSSNVRVHEEVRDWGMVVSPGCMKCQDCVSVCPTGALYYGSGPIALLAKPRVAQPARARPAFSWSEELLLVVVFAGSFLIVRGLYGVVPFLMSLGVAGVMAFLALTSWRLWREPVVERPGLRLKRAGKLVPQGKLFVVLMLALLVFFAHSAVLRTQTWLGDSAFAQIDGLRRVLLSSPGQAVQLPAWAQEPVARSTYWQQRVRDLGLFPTLGNAGRLAWLHALQGQSQQAREQAELALQRGEWPAEMQQLLAHLALLRGDEAAAVGHWQAAVTARPDLPEAYLAHGIHLAGRGQLAAAQQVFERGMQQLPRSAQLAYNAGLARALSGQIEAGAELFEWALELDPEHREARENLAGLLASSGRFAAAEPHYRKALEQAPEDLQTRLLLAQVLIAQQRTEAAVQELRRVLELDAGQLQAKQLLEQLGVQH